MQEGGFAKKIDQPMDKVLDVQVFFKLNEGKVADFQSSLPGAIKLTKTEEGAIDYTFGRNGNNIICREVYKGGDGFVAHCQNVGEALAAFALIGSFERVEITAS